jgi:hypothetical protein
MSKYRVVVNERRQYSAIIEADSEEEALEAYDCGVSDEKKLGYFTEEVISTDLLEDQE